MGLINLVSNGTISSPNFGGIIENIENINKYAKNSNDLDALFENNKTISGLWNFATSPTFGTSNGFLKATAGVLSFESLENSTINLISTTTNINVVTDTDVTLFTVPTGKKLIITNAYLIPTELTSFTSSFSASLGINSTAFDSIFEIKDFTTLDSVDKTGQYLSLSDILPINNAGDFIKLKVTTNAVATTYTVKILLFGFYL